ncbi:MAG: hypothetical protein WCK18_15195 [Prolixibacteraceae bacterium]
MKLQPSIPSNKIFLKTYLFDAFIILFILTINLTIIQDTVFGNIPFAYRIFINSGILIIAFFIRFRTKIFKIKYLPNIAIILCAIWVMDIVQLVIFRSSGLHITSLYILITLYALYLYNCIEYYSIFFSSYKKSFEIVLSPYIYISLYNVFIVILAFILILLGVIQANSNPVEYSLLTPNINAGVDYFYPAHLSIVSAAEFRLSILGDIPMITGLTHEPHVLCFMVFPALFFILANQNLKKRIKYLMIVVYSFVGLLCMSTTTILCLIIVIILHLLSNSLLQKRGYITLILAIVLIIVGYILFGTILKEVILFKTTIATGSRDYSSNMLLFMLTPKSILGFGTVLAPQEIFSGKYQVGLISSFLLILFYMYFFIKIITFVFSKNQITHYIGLGLLYFSLHMLKLGNLIFEYPFLIFMIVVPFAYCQKLKRNNILLYSALGHPKAHYVVDNQID